MTVSPNVVIMTLDELKQLKQQAFERGVARGRFEEQMDQQQAKDLARRIAEYKHALSLLD